jgi:hypothetical protein
MTTTRALWHSLPMLALLWLAAPSRADDGAGLSLSWADNMLTIRGPDLPGGEVKVWYLEAYCRPGSTDRDWSETVIPHRAKLIERSPDGRLLRLRDELADGVIVDHAIRAGKDEVEFRVVASNRTANASQAHWAQPCIRVAPFTGVEQQPSSEEYLPKCFIFLDGRPARMPTEPWATKARYTPGQVWCPTHVDRNDVNPRPLSSLVPSNGLIGCYSADGKRILATAWEPYQELFQGVIVCLHSDFRIGGLAPGESKRIHGKIYLVDSDMDALVERYRKDFPEHRKPGR